MIDKFKRGGLDIMTPREELRHLPHQGHASKGSRVKSLIIWLFPKERPVL